MRLSTVLLTIGVLSCLAGAYFILQANSWEIILPGLLCGASLAYFGIVERKKEIDDEKNN